MGIATVFRTCRSMTGPTSPIRALTRVVATERMCWHCAAETEPSPLCLSGSTTSPSVSIEPGEFIAAQRGGKITPDGFLFEQPRRAGDGVGQRLAHAPMLGGVNILVHTSRTPVVLKRTSSSRSRCSGRMAA